MKKKIQSRDKAQWSEILSEKFLFYCTCVFTRYFKFNYLATGSVRCPLVHMRIFLGMLFLCYHLIGCFFTQQGFDQLVALAGIRKQPAPLVPQPSSVMKKEWAHY